MRLGRSCCRTAGDGLKLPLHVLGGRLKKAEALLMTLSLFSLFWPTYFKYREGKWSIRAEKSLDTSVRPSVACENYSSSLVFPFRANSNNNPLFPSIFSPWKNRAFISSVASPETLSYDSRVEEERKRERERERKSNWLPACLQRQDLHENGLKYGADGRTKTLVSTYARSTAKHG